MISRRSFFTTLAAALVAPVFVRRAVGYFGWKPYTVNTNFERVDGDVFTLLHKRIDESYAIMRRNIATELYGDTSRVLVERGGAWQYITLRESLLEKSEHHFQRAAHWRVQGKPDYAMGSLHKAALAEDRARSLPA